MSKTKIAIFPKIKSLSAAIVLLLLFGCPQNLAPNNYPVKRVSDGDTLVATDSAGKDIKVRLLLSILFPSNFALRGCQLSEVR